MEISEIHEDLMPVINSSIDSGSSIVTAVISGKGYNVKKITPPCYSMYVCSCCGTRIYFGIYYRKYKKTEDK